MTAYCGCTMKVHIIPGRAEAHSVKGTAVLIDVFRATSTIPVMFLRNARSVRPFPKIREARKFARSNRDAVLVGERFGIRVPGFDFNNSPSDILEAELEGKDIAFTSTNGTRVLNLLSGSDRILIASFINHSATVEKLKESEEVWLVRADRPDGVSQEDEIYADYLKKSLLGEKPDLEEYKKRIRNCNGSKILARLGYSRDVEMALRADLASFSVVYQNGEFLKE